jgi:hypothetical protein
MWYHILSMIFLSAVLLRVGGAVTHLPSPWGKMLVKHKWNAIPDDWVSLGLPPNETRIDLHVALKPLQENALVNALYEVSRPRSPKHVLFTTLLEAYSRRFFILDMVHTSQGSRLLSWSHHILKHWTSSARG